MIAFVSIFCLRRNFCSSTFFLAQKGASHRQQIEHRATLLHYALFVYFPLIAEELNNPAGGDDSSSASAAGDEVLPQQQLIEDERSPLRSFLRFFSDESMVNAVQMQAPYLYRYFAAALLIHPQRRQQIRENVKMLLVVDRTTTDASIAGSEQSGLKDPVCDLLLALYHDSDFDLAASALGKIKNLIATDFFLSQIGDHLWNACLSFSFEAICRVHCRISLPKVRSILGLEDDQNDHKMLSLIAAHPNLQARLDLKEQMLVMSNDAPSIQQIILDRTRPARMNTRS